MTSRAITVAGYDPFESEYDSRHPDVVGSLWGEVKSLGRHAAKLTRSAFTPQIASMRAVANLAQGRFRGAAEGMIQDGFRGIQQARNVMNSRQGRWAMTGAAIAFPPAAPAIAGVLAANQLLQEVESGDPLRARPAAAALMATQLAASSNPGAQRAWAAFQTAHALRRQGQVLEAGKAPIRGRLMAADGRVLEGSWVRA